MSEARWYIDNEGAYVVLPSSEAEDPWGGQNPLGCCRDHVTEGGVPVHGGPGCIWPGTDR